MRKLADVLHSDGGSEISFEEIAKAGCQDVVDNIGCNLASLWTFDQKRQAIICVAHYNGQTGEFSSGQVLEGQQYADYFSAIQVETIIRAPIIEEHKATKCLEPYFTEFNVRSLLDVVLTDSIDVKGILCCENQGEQKVWSDEEVKYTGQIATLLTKAWT